MTKKLRDKTEIVTHDFREYLSNTYLEKKKRRPTYSFRAFALGLGTDASTLRKLISGQRPLGKTLIQKFGHKLELSPDLIERFVQHHQRRRSLGTLSVDPVTPRYRKLDARSLAAMSSWQSYALLELMDLAEFKHDIIWIAETLRINVQEVQSTIDKLIEIEWLTVQPDGSWVKVQNPTTVDPKDPQTAAFRQLLMRNIFAKAANTMAEIGKDRRSFQAQTFAIDEALLPEAVEKIRAFRTDMNHLLQKKGKPPNQVYELVIGLYPLSHLGWGDSLRP